MPSLTPDRIDRPALERIIQRAAELQAREREIGDGLSEADLMRLGEEVGIPTTYLRQALLEERTRSVVQAERGFATWLTGPRHVAAQRTISGERRALEAALNQWMTEGELLQVKRRYPDRTSWEPQKGTMVSLKRSFGIGGRQYVLAGAKETMGQVMAVDGGRCHIRLIADLSNTFGEHLWGAGVLAGAGATASAVIAILGFLPVIAALPLAGAVPLAFIVGRSRYKDVERTHVALEQVLDRLEHGEIRVAPEFVGPRASAFVRIAEEIKKSLGIY